MKPTTKLFCSVRQANYILTLCDIRGWGLYIDWNRIAVLSPAVASETIKELLAYGSLDWRYRHAENKPALHDDREKLKTKILDKIKILREEKK